MSMKFKAPWEGLLKVEYRLKRLVHMLLSQLTLKSQKGLIWIGTVGQKYCIWSSYIGLPEA